METQSTSAAEALPLRGVDNAVASIAPSAGGPAAGGKSAATPPPPPAANLTGDWMNFMLLLGLYILQGVPMGFAASVPMYLESRGASFSEQAVFSLATWPYSLKLLWAPIVDALHVRSCGLGLRKTWIVPTQLATGLTLLALSFRIEAYFGAAPGGAAGAGAEAGAQAPLNVWGLTLAFLFLYFLAATQDIAVDGWALKLLRVENLAYASVANTVGQSLGILIAFGMLITLESASLCNALFRAPLGLPEAPHGLMGVGSFMALWGGLFVLFTAALWVFAREDHDDDADAETAAAAAADGGGGEKGNLSSLDAGSVLAEFVVRTPPPPRGVGDDAAAASSAEAIVGAALPSLSPVKSQKEASLTDAAAGPHGPSSSLSAGTDEALVGEGSSLSVLRRRTPPLDASSTLHVAAAYAAALGSSATGSDASSSFSSSSAAAVGGSSSPSDSVALHGDTPDAGENLSLRDRRKAGTFSSLSSSSSASSESPSPSPPAPRSLTHPSGAATGGVSAIALLRESYTDLWRILCLPPIAPLALVVIMSKVWHAPVDTAATLLLQRRGVSRESLAFMDSVSSPLQLGLQVLIARLFASGTRPLSTWMRFFPARLALGLVWMGILFALPHAHSGEAVHPAILAAVFLFSNVQGFVGNVMMMTTMGFFSNISDPTLGGTYMTLLNTVSNLSYKWPQFGMLHLLSAMTVHGTCTLAGAGPGAAASVAGSICDTAASAAACRAGGGACVGDSEGFSTLTTIGIAGGLVWLYCVHARVRALEALPRSAWLIQRPGSSSAANAAAKDDSEDDDGRRNAAAAGKGGL